MFQEADTVLVQFRLPGKAQLPKVVREDDPEKHTDRVDREKQKAGEVLLERNGAVPLHLEEVLRARGLQLVDARCQKRENGSGKIRTLVTFVFGKEPPIASHRAKEIANEGLSTLFDFIQKRWGEARVLRFPGKPTLRVAIFANEVEHPQEAREIADPEAEALGIFITKSTKR